MRNPLALDVLLICPICEVEFHPRRDRVATSVCCSRPCTLAWFKSQKNREIHADRMITFLDSHPEVAMQRGEALEKHNRVNGHPRLGLPRPDLSARIKEYNTLHRDDLIARNRSVEQREKVRQDDFRRWADPEYRKKVFRRHEMSAPEQRFVIFLQKHALSFRFVGDGALWLGRRNPDFVHVSKSLLIEIWGDYYHKGQKPEDRAAYFEQFGYHTLVIWASELPNEAAILERVLAFEGGTKIGSY